MSETMQLKFLMRRLYGHNGQERWRINDYPANYRANICYRVERLAESAGYKTIRTVLVPGGWNY